MSKNTTVMVISKDGERLMPTMRNGKVRHLLKNGKAKCHHYKAAIWLDKINIGGESAFTPT